MNILRSCCTAWLLFVMQPSFAQVITNNPGAINVSGTADMVKSPEVIRLMFKQYGKGAEQDAAKAALAAAEKKLITRLGESGADVIVAHAGAAVPSQNLLNRYRQVFSMIQQRRQANGDNSPASDKNTTCLERYLTVDFKPKANGKEPFVLLADLQERLRKEYQELSGMSDAMPKEDNNDNRVELSMYRNDTSMYTTDVRFLVAAKITREDRVKLYSQAMKRAKSTAIDLAEAAEMKVGGIQSINSSFSSASNVSYGGSMRALTASGDIARYPIALKDDGSETITVREMTPSYQGITQEPLSYQISLNVSFKLEPAK